MAVVAVAPCQCFSPGGNQITSPGRISSIGPPQRCALKCRYGLNGVRTTDRLHACFRKTEVLNLALLN
jgi:hypothetical protein